ncbi:MAG: hypothetical protein E6H57_12840 [Betaproteobacteria bacterium]|nr:MAG: hypothetical protein E6H57_12840 [Betaproteobacteria bacterium]
MNPTAIYSKSGKGVQEAAGKTSLLTRPDRAVLSAIDGRATLADVAQKVGKTFDAAFQTLVGQLDKNGFIREVSAGAAAAPAAAPRPAAAAPKPAAKPGAKAPAESSGGDLDFSSFSAAPKPATPPSKPAAPQALDFSSLGTPSKPASPPPAQTSALNKAREEAEAKAQAERDRLKKEAEAKTRAEMEAKLRAEAEQKQKEEAEAKAKTDAAALKAAEAKLKVEQEAKVKLEAERKAREQTERKAKEEGERARKEGEEKARREQEELKQRHEQERKAREEAERKAREEAERARKELEEERKRLEAERKKEEEERATRRKREEEEAEARRKQRDEDERKVEEERSAKRKQREEQEEAERAAKKKQREEEEAAREQQEEAEREAARAAKRKQRDEEEAAQAAAPKPAAKAPAPKVEAKKDSFADSLLADLDSFTNKDEEESKAKEEAERKAKAEAERRAREEAERLAKAEAEQRRREEEEQRRKEEEARRKEEEEQRHAQEEERRKREADEIRRKAEAATAAAMAKEGKKVAPKAAEEDIPVSDDDLDMDEVKREQAAVAKGKPKEKAEKPEKKKKKPVAAEALPRVRRPGKWGKTAAVMFGLLLAVAIGVAHVVPLDTADYERVATEAFGRPVKIGSANLWLLTGLQVRFADVRVGDAKIAHVTGHLSPGSLFGDKKEFSRIELDGFSLPQQAIGDALFATVKSDSFTVERIVVKSLEVPGPATLPKSLQADIALDAKGGMKSATVRGPDALVAKITPRDDGVIFELTAAGFTLPIAPQVTLSNFAMKGNATPRGMTIAEWGGSILGGAMTGTANVRWGGNWMVDGVVTARNINAAVFAPALLSSGSAEGTGRFSMSAPDPGTLVAAGRIDGNFTVSKGTLGSFDLARAIQSGGKQFAGSTQFVEMNGQGSYNRGAVSLRNVTIGAGALNAGASADISESGALSGRIVADVRTAARTLSATLLLGGTVKEPQVRN